MLPLERPPPLVPVLRPLVLPPLVLLPLVLLPLVLLPLVLLQPLGRLRPEHVPR